MERFDRIEATATAFASQVQQLGAGGQFTASGLTARCQDLQAAATDEAMGIVTLIEAAIASDRKVIADALAAPKPTPSTEDGLALAYAQNLALAKYTGPNAQDRLGVWGDLQRAIDTGDAITAQVLADLLPSLVLLPSGDASSLERMTALQQRAARLRATPELKAALALQDLLDGSYDQAPGVAAKAQFVKMAYGSRLSLILQRAGSAAALQGIGTEQTVDSLRGTFTLAFPLPPGMESPPVGVSPSDLVVGFGTWFRV